MLERGEVLLVWRLGREPESGDDLPIPARRIFDHRKLFLEYEGTLSKGRGSVTRVDSGTVVFENLTDDCGTITLVGERLSGRFHISGGDETGELNRA